ncbi:MAG: WD40 repeat domain-containing protein, partial [Phycisphaerales bacterium]
SGKELAILRGHEFVVTSAAFSPDGTRVVTASWDNTARGWDAQCGKELAILRGHEGEVTTATFSPDGTRVVTASLDGTARIWHSTPYRERFPAIRAAREAETRARVAINARIAAGETILSIRDNAIADRSRSEVDRTAYLIVTCELLEAQRNTTN